jgi:DNA-binding NarL/FixJ family response regulator
MRVFIFSYIRLFVETLSASLKQYEYITDVRICYQANKFVSEAVNNLPDIVLVDCNTEAAFLESRAICQALPKTPVIAISVPEIRENVMACVDAGLFGYVPRQASIDQLLTSMLMALNGECNCNAKITAFLIREIQNRRKTGDEELMSGPLTRRESQIVRLVGLGFSNKQIANDLTLSVATVKNHLHNIFSKYQVHSRAEIMGRLRNEPWSANSG